MEAYKCDRCGKYFPKTETCLVLGIEEALKDGESVQRIHRQDLCPACQDQLERWFYRLTKKQQQKVRQLETPELNGGFIFR